MRILPVFVSICVLLLAVGVYRYEQPLPALALTTVLPESTTPLPGQANVPWPARGSAALAADNIGIVASMGDDKPRPIASVTKVMTAYLILKLHPLKVGEMGPDPHRHRLRRAPVQHPDLAGRIDRRRDGEREDQRVRPVAGPAHPFRQQLRSDAGQLGRGLPGRLHRQDERHGQAARHEEHEVRRRQRYLRCRPQHRHGPDHPGPGGDAEPRLRRDRQQEAGHRPRRRDNLQH